MRTETRLLRFLTLLLLYPALVAEHPLLAQEVAEDDVIKVQSNLVALSFTVKDGKGNPVSGLHKEDFEVLEDNKPQDISFFDTSPFFANSQDPLAVALVLSWNPSMMESHRKIALAALESWQRALPQDTLIGLFLGECPLLWFTNAKTVVQDASSLLTEMARRNVPCGSANLGDIVAMVARNLGELPRTPAGLVRKKVLFIVHNELLGGPLFRETLNYEKFLYARMARELKENKITPYAAVTPFNFAPPLEKYKNSGMEVPLFRAFVDAGGKVFHLTGAFKDEGERFGNVFAELQHSYQLAYVPKQSTPDGKLHKIKIRLKRRGLKVVGAREGYFALTPEQLADQQKTTRESVRPTNEWFADLSPLKLKFKRAEQEITIVNDPLVRLNLEAEPVNENIVPLRAEFGVKDVRAQAYGTYAVRLTVLFDYNSLRVVRTMNSSYVGVGTGVMKTGPFFDFSNLDLRIQVDKEGEAAPVLSVRTTLANIVEYKLLRQFQESGIEYAIPLTLKPGKYRYRLAARDTVSGRVTELNETLEVSESGVEQLPSRSRPELEELLDRVSLNAAAGDVPSKRSGAGDSTSANGPLNVALLIDAHQLMRKKHLAAIASAVGEFLPNLRPFDELGVVAVNDHATKVSDFTRNHAAAVPAISGILSSSSDEVSINDYEAIKATSAQMMRESIGRRVMVWLTDLNNNFREFLGEAAALDILKSLNSVSHQDSDLALAPFDEALDAVRTSNTILYVVVLPNRFSELPTWEDKRNRRKGTLRKFAEASGGRLFTLRQMSELPQVLSRIVSEQSGDKSLPGTKSDNKR